MSEGQMREVLAQLTSLLDDVEALLAVLDDAPALGGPAKDGAREMLRRLKDRIRREHRRTSTVKGRAALNLVERHFYAPALQEAHADLQIRIASQPGPAWLDDLRNVERDLEAHARQLRDALAVSG